MSSENAGKQPEVQPLLTILDVRDFFLKAGMELDSDTARRYLGVICSMTEKPEKPNLFVERTPAPKDGLVVEAPRIPISSYCRHHLLPWMGWVKISYKPDEWILGLSKFKRLVDYCSAGLALQEEVTKEIHGMLWNVLGVAPKIEIRGLHTCATVRGVKLSPDFEYVTRID